MNRSAQVILTGYDKTKIDESVKIIKKYSKQVNIEIHEGLGEIKAKSELWGCNKDNAEQRILFLTGTQDALQSILDAKTLDGIYLQLLLK